MLHLIHSTKSQTTVPIEAALMVPWAMSYSEASYFEGFHYQHIADWEDFKRTKMLNARSARIVRERRHGSRAR